MKLKLFGLTFFEIERNPDNASAEAARPIRRGPASRQPELRSAEAPRIAQPNLSKASHILPRTPKGTIDVEASLQLLGITDPDDIWLHRFEPGTAGAALKCILGAQRRKTRKVSEARDLPDICIYPTKELPVEPGTRKLDLNACLALFGIQDPSVLWQKRFGPDSAGGRIKMRLRASGFVPAHLRHVSGSADRPDREAPTPSRDEKGPACPTNQEAHTEFLRQDAQGNIDIQTSLEALAINDPKSLWLNPVKPGSAEHILKKEIARRLARHESLSGITRSDVGLTM
jgi:hypothetical protein